MSRPLPPPVGRIALPPGAESPIRVFVNGEERAEGADWRVEDGVIVFTTPLRPRPDLGFWRSFTLSLGIGVYGDLKGDTLDVTYHRDGVMRQANLAIREAGTPA